MVGHVGHIRIIVCHLTTRPVMSMSSRHRKSRCDHQIETVKRSRLVSLMLVLIVQNLLTMSQTSPDFQHIHDWLHAPTRAYSSSTVQELSSVDNKQILDTSHSNVSSADDVLDQFQLQAETPTVAKRVQNFRTVIDDDEQSRVLPTGDCAIPTKTSRMDDEPLATGLRMVDRAIEYIETLTSYGCGTIRMDDAVKSVALMHKAVLWLETLKGLASKERVSIPRSRRIMSANGMVADRWKCHEGCCGIELVASQRTSDISSRSSSLACIVLRQISLLNRLVGRIEESDLLLE